MYVRMRRYEWTQSQTHLRVVALPEEYYCPRDERQRQRQPLSLLAASTWRTSWRNGVYRCRSLHGHGFFEAARAHFDNELHRYLQRREHSATTSG